MAGRGGLNGLAESIWHPRHSGAVPDLYGEVVVNDRTQIKAVRQIGSAAKHEIAGVVLPQALAEKDVLIDLLACSKSPSPQCMNPIVLSGAIATGSPSTM